MKLKRPRAPFIFMKAVPGHRGSRTATWDMDGKFCRVYACSGGGTWQVYGPWAPTRNEAIRRWNKFVSRMTQKDNKS